MFWKEDVISISNLMNDMSIGGLWFFNFLEMCRFCPLIDVFKELFDKILETINKY